jgi:hypothetical protein
MPGGHPESWRLYPPSEQGSWVIERQPGSHFYEHFVPPSASLNPTEGTDMDRVAAMESRGDAVEREESKMGAALNHLDNVVGAFAVFIKDMDRRLQPIMAEPSPIAVAESQDKQPSSDSELVIIVNKLAQQLSSALRDGEHLLGRLQI